MMSFSLSGGVEVYGFIAPTEITDEYPVIDPLYGIDGFRNVDTLNDLNNIPTLRRRAGMVVGIGGGTQYYKLNPGPWNGTITDWTIFNSGGNGGTFTGGTVTGPTIFTNGLTANTLTVNGVPITGDTYTTGGTYSNGTINFYYNTGGGYQVTGITDNNIYTTGFTYSANTFYITDTSGNTFSATIDVMTGLTINGDLTVTGTTSLQGFSTTTISATTIGTSGDCVDDIYVSNIHSCSPLNINPLNEGNVYFGSTSGVTIDLTNNRVGIGTSLPQETLHISGTSRFDNDVTIWDDGVFNGNSRKLYFRGLGQTGNTQTGEIVLDAFGGTNKEYLQLRAGGVRFIANDVDGTIQFFNLASNNPKIQSVQSGGLSFEVNSTTNGFTFGQGYTQTTGDLFSIYNSGPTKAFSILASNGNVGVGDITPQYKLDVSGETRSRDRIYAGVFTPGTMLQPTDYFVTTGRIVAGGGINFRSPIVNDNTWTGFGFGGFDTAGISIKVRNGEIGSFGGYGGDVNPYLYFGGAFNPLSGNTSKNFIQLNPIYLTPNDLSYTGGIRGFLYNPNLISISGVSFHRAIETTTGDVIFGSTSGNVGIGTTTPSEKLDVNGKTKTINLQVTSGATAGYVLTAVDSSGNTQWVALGSNNNELDPVLTITGTTPSVVNIGDRFLISGGTGIWSGRTNQIAEYTGVTPTDYSYYIPVIDDVVFVTDTLTTYRFDGTNWISWRGTAILQNGNSLTTSVNIGSNNNQNLTLRTSGQTRVSIDTSGSTTLFGSTTLVRPQGSDYLVFSSSTLANSGQTMYIRQIASNTHVFGTNLLQTFMQVGPGNRINLNGQELTTNGSAVFGANRIGNTNMLNLNSIPSGTTGTTDWRGVLVNPTVNFGGTYSGNFIGYLHNPTITSMANGRHIAMQIVSGDVLLNTTSGNTGIGTTTPTAKLQVSGTTLLQTFTGTTGLISAATQNVLTIVGSGNTTSSPIFTVQGSSGELFSVSDSLVGSLFSVNDISGLPILEVFSDNTTLMGSYLAPSLNTTARVIATTGTTNVYSIPTSAYTGAFFDYTISDGTNLRAGNIMSIWSGTSVNITETQTTDFGNTSGLTFNMVVSSGNAILRTSGTTGNWTVKTIVRSI